MTEVIEPMKDTNGRAESLIAKNAGVIDELKSRINYVESLMHKVGRQSQQFEEQQQEKDAFKALVKKQSDDNLAQISAFNFRIKVIEDSNQSMTKNFKSLGLNFKET